MLLCGILVCSYHVAAGPQLPLLVDVVGSGKVISSGAKLTFGVLIAGFVLVVFVVVTPDTKADAIGAVGVVICTLLLLALYDVAVELELALALDATE